MADEIKEDRGYMERLEKKCADLTNLIAAAEGSRDQLQADSYQQANKIARLMEASRTAESDLSRCKKELIEVELQRRRQRNLYLAARDERNAAGKNSARGCISLQIIYNECTMRSLCKMSNM